MPSRGAARALGGTLRLCDWAQSQQVTALVLMVTSGNEAAIRFYERLGFVPTGHTGPYPNDTTLLEIEMRLPIEPFENPERLTSSH